MTKEERKRAETREEARGPGRDTGGRGGAEKVVWWWQAVVGGGR